MAEEATASALVITMAITTKLRKAQLAVCSSVAWNKVRATVAAVTEPALKAKLQQLGTKTVLPCCGNGRS